MSDPNNYNNEIEIEPVFQIEIEQDKGVVKKRKKMIAKVEENLATIVMEKISGRMGEC